MYILQVQRTNVLFIHFQYQYTVKYAFRDNNMTMKIYCLFNKRVKRAELVVSISVELNS